MAGTNFSQEMKSLLAGYSDRLCHAVEEVIEAEAKEAASTLQQASPKRKGKGGGKYAKSWTSDVIKGRTFTSADVHNKKYYQLSHLLENGHANRDGGRTQPYVHIAPVEETAVRNVEEKIKRMIQEGGY